MTDMFFMPKTGKKGPNSFLRVIMFLKFELNKIITYGKKLSSFIFCSKRIAVSEVLGMKKLDKVQKCSDL